MAIKRAKGKKSRAISDQSGFSVPYTSLKTTWEGFRVEPEEWEPKHPQLTPAKNVIDATALFQPRPDNDEEVTAFYVGFNYDIFLDRNQRPNVGISGSGYAGNVEIHTSIDEAGVAGTGAVGTESPGIEVTGVSGAGSSGAVGVEALSISIDEAGVAGTGAVGSESVEVLGWGQEGWGIAEWGD